MLPIVEQLTPAFVDLFPFHLRFLWGREIFGRRRFFAEILFRVKYQRIWTSVLLIFEVKDEICAPVSHQESIKNSSNRMMNQQRITEKAFGSDNIKNLKYLISKQQETPTFKHDQRYCTNQILGLN